MGVKRIAVVVAIVLAPVMLLGGYGMFVLMLLGGTAAAGSSSGCTPTSTAAPTPAPTATPTPRAAPECAPPGMAVAPLGPGYNVTSDFGYRGDIGLDGVSEWHAGIDLQNPSKKCGDPVFAVLPGTVILSSNLFLSIKHADGFIVSYLHMFKSQRLVDVGDRVAAGEQIGATGRVAPATGCHLDLRIALASTKNPAVLALADRNQRGWVDPEAFMNLYGVVLCDPALCRRPN